MVISVKKTMHTRFLALVLSAMLLLPALAGCSKKTGAEKDLAYPIDGEPVCLDPQIAADETAKLVTGNCFEGLVRHHPQHHAVRRGQGFDGTLRNRAVRGLSVWMNQAQSCPEPPSGGMCRRTGAPTPFICARG